MPSSKAPRPLQHGLAILVLIALSPPSQSHPPCAPSPPGPLLSSPRSGSRTRLHLPSRAPRPAPLQTETVSGVFTTRPEPDRGRGSSAATPGRTPPARPLPSGSPCRARPCSFPGQPPHRPQKPSPAAGSSWWEPGPSSAAGPQHAGRAGTAHRGGREGGQKGNPRSQASELAGPSTG